LDNGLGYRLATFRISGEALMGGIQYGLTKSAEDDNDEFLAQVSGMSYRYLSEGTGLGKSYTLVGAKVGNAPIDPARMYSVTTNEFVPMFLTMLGITYEDLHVYRDTTEFQVVSAFVAQIDTLRPKTESRVECVTVTAVEKSSNSVPRIFSLEQNFPNPFNPSTEITFSLPHSSMVTLTVYNLLGKEVAILVNEPLSAGQHSCRFMANGYASGVYFYKLTADGFVQTRRMVLTK
jgi:hypothetical protein